MKKDDLNSNPELLWTFLNGSKRTAGILEIAAIAKGRIHAYLEVVKTCWRNDWQRIRFKNI